MSAFCSLCGNTNEAELGQVIGICLDKDACHQHQYVKAREAGAREERDRIIELAEHHNVRVDMGPLSDPPTVPFADMLRDKPQAAKGVRYRVPVSDSLLWERDVWLPIEGFRLISVDGPSPVHHGVSICTFEDDDAPAFLRGQLVELTITKNISGRVTITNRKVLTS